MANEARPARRRRPLVIGWRERVDLPEWGIAGISAKSDTGARSTALDVSHIEERPGNRVHFEVAVDREHPDARVPVECDISRRAIVKSSLGNPHERIFVKTVVLIGRLRIRTEVGLVDREGMQCRMLLGRRTLAGRFLVDSKSTHLLDGLRADPDRDPERDPDRDPGRGDAGA